MRYRPNEKAHARAVLENYCIFNFFTQGSKDVGSGQRMAKPDVLYITEMSL